jgi:hypothetical protein
VGLAFVEEMVSKEMLQSFVFGGRAQGCGSVQEHRKKNILRLIGGNLMQQAFRNILHS